MLQSLRFFVENNFFENLGKEPLVYPTNDTVEAIEEKIKNEIKKEENTTINDNKESINDEELEEKEVMELAKTIDLEDLIKGHNEDLDNKEDKSNKRRKLELDVYSCDGSLENDDEQEFD